MVHSTLMKKRHDAIIERLNKAAGSRWTIQGENQVVDVGNLRPDLLLKKGNDILIIDVTVPFENGLEALEDARKEKLENYSDLARELSNDYVKAKVEAVIEGSLGSWDPGNDALIKRLCSNKYAKMMRKIIASETIAYSQDIYAEHTRTLPQYSGGRQVNRRPSPG